MVHYRTLIEDLLEAKPQTIRPKLAESKPTATELPAARPAEVRPEPEVRETAAEQPEPPRVIESEPAADTSLRPEAESRMETNRA